MTDKLKPCPFCGGYNVGVYKCEYFYRSYLYAAKCYDCHVELKMVETEEEAIELWNTRKPMDSIVEQAEELADDRRKYWEIYGDDEVIDLVAEYNKVIAIVKGVQNDY